MSTNTTHEDAKTVDALTAIAKGQKVHHQTHAKLVRWGYVLKDGQLTDMGRAAVATQIEAAAPVKPKRSRKMRPCTCGCGSMTSDGKFLPGQKARWAGETGRQAAQTLKLGATQAEALAAVADLTDSHVEVSDALLAKAARIAIATRAKIGVPKPAKA